MRQALTFMVVVAILGSGMTVFSMRKTKAERLVEDFIKAAQENDDLAYTVGLELQRQGESVIPQLERALGHPVEAVRMKTCRLISTWELKPECLTRTLYTLFLNDKVNKMPETRYYAGKALDRITGAFKGDEESFQDREKWRTFFKENPNFLRLDDETTPES